MLGIVIFGLTHKQKKMGELQEYACPDCGHVEQWELVRRRRWFTVFFIPILPMGRAAYWRKCPVCGLLNSVDKNVEEVKELAMASSNNPIRSD